MKKIVPLISLNQVENYKKSKVDAVLMGTYFSATRQQQIYSLEEIIDVNEKIPVIGCFNRFYFEPELAQLEHEIKALYEGGVDAIICTDLAVMEIVNELGLDLHVILDTDTTMTNVEEVKMMYKAGASEIVLGRELTLAEKLSIAQKLPKGAQVSMHFFGYQLMSFSRRKHLAQYAHYRNLDWNLDDIYWLKEKNREDLYMTLEDRYGTHMYAPKVLSAIHAYQDIKGAGFTSIFFEPMGIDIEDVLFVVRSLDLVNDTKQLEESLKETVTYEIGTGLLYQETGKGK